MSHPNLILKLESNDDDNIEFTEFNSGNQENANSRSNTHFRTEVYIKTESDPLGLDFLNTDDIFSYNDYKEVFTCFHCNETFDHKSTLQTHMRIHNSRHKRHVCGYCGQEFRKRQDFVYHERIHQGERPYACSNCYKTFISKCDLISHESIHGETNRYLHHVSGPEMEKHPDKKEDSGSDEGSQNSTYDDLIRLGERPYTCSDCYKSFISEHDLFSHELIHRKRDSEDRKVESNRYGFPDTDVVEEAKQKELSFKRKLKLFMLLVDENFTCNYCEKTFNHKKNLENHIKNHKQFICGLCKESFTSGVDYLLHNQIHAYKDNSDQTIEEAEEPTQILIKQERSDFMETKGISLFSDNGDSLEEKSRTKKTENETRLSVMNQEISIKCEYASDEENIPVSI